LAWLIIISPFQWVMGAVSWTGRAIVAWWTSRRWRHFLWGLPSVGVIIVSLYFGMNVAATTTTQLSLKYLQAGRFAGKQEDWARSLLYLERAIELGLRDREAYFELAVAAEHLKDESRKVAVLQKLAPDTHAVYAPAHLWKARQILSAGTINKTEAANAEKQLKFTLQLDPENKLVHSILGDLYFQARLWPAAAEHLRAGDRSDNKYQLLLARASAAAGNVDFGMTVASAVFDNTQEIITRDPSDVDARLQLAEAALMLERYEVCVRVLQEGLAMADRKEFRAALSMVLVHWSDSLLRNSPEKRDHAWQLLASALELNPSELVVFDRIIQFLKTGDSTTLNAEEFLKGNIVHGRSVGMSHLILGTVYLERNEIKMGGVHLQQAFDQIPNGAVVANNFAWYLVKQDPPEPTRALQIIEAVEGSDTTRPEFHDTKGHIYLALARWKDAIREFEVALPQMNAVAATHRGLATAYREIGLADVAAEHLTLAEKLESGELRRAE